MAIPRMLLPLAIFLVLSFGDASGKANLVHRVCSSVTFRDLCVSTLSSDALSKSADKTQLAILSIKVAKDHAKETYSYIQQLQRSTADPSLQQSLTDCSEEYADVIEQLQDSIGAFDTKSYTNINTWVSAAMSDIQSCEDGLKEQEVDNSELVKKNAVTSNLCSNALAIVKLLG